LSEQGTGVVTATPDLLTLTIGVSSTGPTATTALSANDTAGTAVLAAFKAGGVAAKDLQTTGLSIQAEYAMTGTVVTGYEVDDTVVAKIRTLTTAGTLIDAAVTAGGNAVRIDGLAFSLTNPRPLQDQARTEAVHRAVSHAEAMAAAAGEHLGALCSLTDENQTGGTTTPVIFRAAAGSSTAGSAAAAPSVPVQTGSQTVSDQVRVVYALVPDKAHHR
jgi:uncharacterized protein YggE